MFDKPSPSLLSAEARGALDAGVAPGFPQKVIANALGIAQRELDLGPAMLDEEHERLGKLVGPGDDLPALNAKLAAAIGDGAISLDNADLIAHLIRTAIAKLEVDQPAYPAFRAWRDSA